ncbi:MAG TPA: tripartite tricarboxylate transporter substrate binding protein [Burkholderiales bacterium]|jgi:tripartite-type tricarboxylate transporter receptor subunit TctC|nr:tripartite tricarboxylate transporter substrate binding protein [Burkholderiales bacterium]
MKLVVALLTAALCHAAYSQPYPSKPIRLVVPFAPGGSSTLVARFMSEEMAKGLGTSVVIENKPGGGGNIAMQEVARAAPDGYTLIIGHVGSLAMNPYMYERLPYDVDKDFAAVSLLAIVPNIFVVYHEVPAKDLREFVALAKAKPGQINYGSAGNGSAGHLAMEYLKQVAGIELQHVPYKGTGPNVTDLIAGRTQATSAGTPPLLPHVKSGKLRVIAVGTSKRLHSIPDVATVAEQGYPGFETSQWYGLNAPAGTPEPIIRRLAEEARKAAKSALVLERFKADDAEAVGSTPQEYAAFIKKEQERWSKVVRAANVKAD